MKNKNIVKTFVVFLVLGMALLMTSCFFNDDADVIFGGDEVDSALVRLTIELPSDSDNGLEWNLEQSPVLFDYEDAFLLDEGVTDGSGELHSFTMVPMKGGNTTLTFTNTTGDATYTYECQITDKKDDIVVNSATGKVNGQDVEAPTAMVEND